MRIINTLTLFLVGVTMKAQLANGSFEDALGNPSDSGWVSTCTAMPGPAAPGMGNWSMLVPHSNAPGCGWSRMYQLVPVIGDGETWTFSGWCSNFTWFWADPYMGLRFGVKDAQGNLSFNTAALQNTGQWTYLSVTNSFTLAPGDTVFVECDPGTVSGMGNNQVFANFDGLELTSLSTGVHVATERPLALHPNPVAGQLWMAPADGLSEVKAISSEGAVHELSFSHSGSTAVIDATGLASGVHMLWARYADHVRTARFVKR
jgi:hypothetical protein